MKINKLISAAGMSLLLSSGAAFATNVPVFNTNYPVPNAACATFGDLVSCSTAVLDHLSAQYPETFIGPYSFSTAQGQLLDTIVLGVNNGNITENSDLATPSEDAFSTITPGKNYFYTGEAERVGTNDPTNNGTLVGDTSYSWDMGIGTLIDKLTFDGAFHQLLVGFDMNEQQSSTASLPIWAMVTVRDLDDQSRNISFETQAIDPSNPFKSVTSYTSTKSFDGSGVTTPASTDFAMTVGTICVVNELQSYPSPDGSSCPYGGTLINTNRASNQLEFINYFPELDLKAFLANGYDSLSVQIWMGCFGGDDSKAGPVLADGIAVTECDTGGFGDIFLLAGATESRVPEPGSALLAGLGLLGLIASRMHRKNANA